MNVQPYWPPYLQYYLTHHSPNTHHFILIHLQFSQFVFFVYDEDGLMEYYYDLVIWTPESEDILTQLCSSKAVKAWKLVRPSRLLSLDFASHSQLPLGYIQDVHSKVVGAKSYRRSPAFFHPTYGRQAWRRNDVVALLEVQWYCPLQQRQVIEVDGSFRELSNFLWYSWLLGEASGCRCSWPSLDFCMASLFSLLCDDAAPFFALVLSANFRISIVCCLHLDATNSSAPVAGWSEWELGAMLLLMLALKIDLSQQSNRTKDQHRLLCCRVAQSSLDRHVADRGCAY